MLRKRTFKNAVLCRAGIVELLNCQFAGMEKERLPRCRGIIVLGFLCVYSEDESLSRHQLVEKEV